MEEDEEEGEKNNQVTSASSHQAQEFFSDYSRDEFLAADQWLY